MVRPTVGVDVSVGGELTGLPCGDVGDEWGVKMWGCLDGVGESLGERAAGEVRAAVSDQPEQCGVPEGGGAAVAQEHLEVRGELVELFDVVLELADEVLDRCAAV